MPGAGRRLASDCLSCCWFLLTLQRMPPKPGARRVRLEDRPGRGTAHHLMCGWPVTFNSRKVLSLIYQPLVPELDPDTLDLGPLAGGIPAGVRCTDAAYPTPLPCDDARWSDGTPFTSRDVAFTGQLIQSFKVPRYAIQMEVYRPYRNPR